jgi:hypothetical protein
MNVAMSDIGLIGWILLVAIPPGLALAGYWARGRSRSRKSPKVPPGDPGNPA